MKTIKCNVNHRLGNWIQALVTLFESLVILLTLGFVYPGWTMKWVLFRISSKFYQQDKRNYDKSLTDDIDDDIMTVEDWTNAVNGGCFHPNDGVGYWVKDEHVSKDEVFSTPPLDATHVIWYNK